MGSGAADSPAKVESAALVLVVEANDIAGLDCIRRSGKPFPTVEGGDAPMLKLQSEIIAAVVAVIVGVVLWRTANSPVGAVVAVGLLWALTHLAIGRTLH